MTMFFRKDHSGKVPAAAQEPTQQTPPPGQELTQGPMQELKQEPIQKLQAKPTASISPNLQTPSRGAAIHGSLIVGAGVQLQGSFTVPTKSTISGLVKGDLNTNDLTVEKGGTVQGQIDCQTADIAGQIENLIQVHQFLILRSSAVAVGDIHYQEILIEKGAKITGKLVRLS
jgi:cytoskeletal protein CcmA (bactofilin family)